MSHQVSGGVWCCVGEQTQCTSHSLATVTVSTAELRRPAMPASGMVTVAVQVYCPPSDALSGESVWLRADVFI